MLEARPDSASSRNTAARAPSMANEVITHGSAAPAPR